MSGLANYNNHTRRTRHSLSRQPEEERQRISKTHVVKVWGRTRTNTEQELHTNILEKYTKGEEIERAKRWVGWKGYLPDPQLN